MPRNAGYTLIELLVVLAIIGLLAALATPMAGQAIAGATLRADSRTIVSLLRAQQHAAVEEQRTVTVAPSDVQSMRGDYRLGADASVSGDAVAFYPDGTSSGGTLHLREGARALDVQVAWLTGAASVGEAP